MNSHLSISFCLTLTFIVNSAAANKEYGVGVFVDMGTPYTDMLLPTKLLEKPNGTGPLPLEILTANPRLSYIGAINSKSFYIERTTYNWDAAVAYCRSLGLKIARFDTDAEKNFIYGALPSSDGQVWTGAKLDMSNRYWYNPYYWRDTLTQANVVGQYQYSAEAVRSLNVDGNHDYPNRYFLELKSNTHYVICFD